MDKFSRHYFGPKKPKIKSVMSKMIEIRSALVWGRESVLIPKGHK